MNREELHRRFLHVREGFVNTDNNFAKLEKVVDKAYLNSLTHVMMWDVLLGLLDKKGIISKAEFDATLKELSDKTKAAMEADQKRQAEASESSSKVTVESDVPAIPVVK
jgi:hypothetical protein